MSWFWLGVGLGVGLLFVLTLLVMARRGSRRRAAELATVVTEAERDRLEARASIASLQNARDRASSGELEASWALSRETALNGALRRDHDKALTTLAATEANLSRVEDALAEVRSHLAEAEQELDMTRGRLDEADNSAVRLEADTARLSQELDAAREREDGLADQLANGQTELTRLAGRAETAAAEQAALEAEVETLRSRLSEAISRADIERSQLESVSAQRDEALADIQAVEAKLQELESTAAQLRKDLTAASDAAEVARARAAAASMEVERSRGAESRLVAREADIADLEARLEAVTSARASELRRLHQQIKDLEHLYVEVDRRDSEISRLTDELKDVQDLLSQSSTPQTPPVTQDRELERLRADLRLERERNLRLGRRHGMQATQLEDDLTRIKGVGPVIAGILNDNGITRFLDLAEASTTQLEQVGAALPIYPGRIQRDRWVEQARKFASER